MHDLPHHTIFLARSFDRFPCRIGRDFAVSNNLCSPTSSHSKQREHRNVLRLFLSFFIPVDRAASGQPFITGTIAPSQRQVGPTLHHRTPSSCTRPSLDDKNFTALPSRSEKQHSQENNRPSSYTSSTDSDDFSLWSDTGDIAEQLAEEEDLLRIQLQPLDTEGRALDGQGGKKKRRVHYLKQDHLERKNTNPGIVKEAICIPEPAPRRISRFEKYFAYIMALNDRETARKRGLVGKPLL